MRNLDDSKKVKSPARERVYFGVYPYNLIRSGNLQKYYQLLCNFDFLLGKIQHPAFGVQALIEDYDLLDNPEVKKHPDYNPEVVKALRFIQGALRLSAHVLMAEPTQLASQLWGRLQSFDIPDIQRLLQQTKQNQTVWLRPLKSSLTPSGGRLLRILTGHSDSVNAIAVSPDGTQVVSGLENGVLKVWDLKTGKDLLTLIGHCKLVTAIAITPDNKRVISASEDGTLRVWDLSQGKELFTLAESGYIAMALAITSDSNWVISVGRNETKDWWNGSIWHNCITLWDLKTTEHIFSEEILLNKRYTEEIKLADAVALSSDGTKAIFCSTFSEKYKFSSLKVKNLKGWHEILKVPNSEAKLNPNHYITWIKTKLLEQLNQENLISINDSISSISDSRSQGKITTVAVTPDGNQAITGSKDSTLIVWDIETEQQKFRLTGHSDAITAVAITSDGTQAVSSSKDRTLKIWDLKTGEEISTFTDFNNLVDSIAITPDGKYLISGSRDKTLKIWHFNHKKSQIYKNQENYSKLCLKQNSNSYSSNSYSSRKSIKESIKESILIVFFGFGVLFSNLLFDLVFKKVLILVAPFLIFFLIIFHLIFIGLTIFSLFSWHFPLFVKEWTISENDSDSKNAITAIAITLDGNQVVYGSKDNTLKIWDLNTRQQLYNLNFHRDQVSALAVTPKMNYIISGSLYRTLKIWNTKNPKKVIHLKSWGEIVYNSLHLIVIISLFILYLFFLSIIITSPLNQYKLLSSLFLLLIFVCFSVILVSLFIIFINKINHNQITAITITSDGSKAISALKNKTLQVWNLTKQKQIFVLRGHRDWVTSIVLVSDNYLISGSRDKTLKVWNLKTRKELFTLIGHAAPVTSVAVTPNGSHIISASSDGVLKIWNLQTHKEIQTLNNHHNSVEAIAVTPDGQYLVSASNDHTLKVWDLLTGEEKNSFTTDCPLTCCTITPEGSTIIAGDQAGQLHFLRLEGIQALS